nr:immunoglobulin light chain junction region [Macaca mulatta]
CGQASHLPYTF